MPSGSPTRCGECASCRIIGTAQVKVLAAVNQAANRGEAVDDGVIRLWNGMLADYPCEKLKKKEMKMTKEQALELIDEHKKKMKDPVEMLHWTHLRVIILNIPDEAWKEALQIALITLRR